MSSQHHGSVHVYECVVHVYECVVHVYECVSLWCVLRDHLGQEQASMIASWPPVDRVAVAGVVPDCPLAPWRERPVLRKNAVLQGTVPVL